MGPIGTKPGSWGILHRTDVGIFDPSKNIAAVTKNRTKAPDSSFSLGLAKF